MVDIIWNILLYTSRTLILILVIYGFIKYNKLQSYNKYLHVIFCYYLGFEFISFVYLNILVKPILFMLPIYFFVEYILYIILFLLSFNFNKIRIVVFINTLSLILMVFFTYQTLLDYKSENYQLYGKVVSNLTIMTNILVYFIRSISDKKNKLKNKELLFNSILFVYFSVNLLVYLSHNFMINSKLGIYYFMVHCINLIIFYLLMFFHIKKYTSKSK